MSQAIVDPAEVRRFASNLKRFNADLQAAVAGLHGQLMALGDSWRDQSRVTGTEGHFARNRNPSERSGKPQVFANARVFKAEEKHEAHPNNVTGILTVRADGKARGARVTVSGGAVT